FDGQIDEFRIWNGALSDEKAAANFAIGPNPADDSDIDGLPDTWELSFTGITSLTDLDGNLSAGNGPGAASGDFDGDGLSDADEYNGGDNSTDPTDTDSDNDGFPDPIERILGTDPNDPNDKPGAVLAHRYSFNVDSSDVVGSANLSLIGSASVASGSLDLPGGATRTNHANAQGAALAELATTINDSYALTIECWFNQDTAQNWAKLFMAGKGIDYNYIGITPRRGADANVSSLSIRISGTENNARGGADGGPLVNNTNYYCATIWNPLTNQLILHIGPVGGTLHTYTATMGGQQLAEIVVNEFRVGAAVQWPDPDFDGQIDELRIWRGALSNSDVAASFAAGPGQPAGDVDGDGLDDAWEFAIAGVNHLDEVSPGDDLDNDGLTNLGEFQEGTDPDDADSDNDGFTDGFEVAQETDPNDSNDKPVIPPTILAHRYSFATDASDSVGGADLTTIGTASVTGGALQLPGGSSRTNCAIAPAATLPVLETTVRDSVALSMECWFRQNAAQNWSKLFMAGRGAGGEYLDITPRRGNSGNVPSISFNNGSVESTAIGTSAGQLPNNVDHYCAAVWNPVTDQLTISIGPVGGILKTHTASLGGRSLTAVAINEFYLGAAVQFPDPDFNGSIDEFRIWSGALDSADIARHFTAGTEAFTVDPVVDTVAMNEAKDILTIHVSGLVPTLIYHLQESAVLDGFAPVPGSQFTATGETRTIQIAIDPSTVPKRFFRLAEGAP
ncbi:MAG: hypothetical protein KDN05_11155, partial [Verrucomicrobiae bacterium]|nr:hypothetical protein [Verrucomicrobiae bacterium]